MNYNYDGHNFVKYMFKLFHYSQCVQKFKTQCVYHVFQLLPLAGLNQLLGDVLLSIFVRDLLVPVPPHLGWS